MFDTEPVWENTGWPDATKNTNEKRTFTFQERFMVFLCWQRMGAFNLPGISFLASKC
jgi:hypothetical protein